MSLTYIQSILIPKYSQFANGILDDYNAVQNSLLYPDISNGPIEGINSRIKMKHRRSVGREGLELLNAYMVIPISGCYKKAGTGKNKPCKRTSVSLV